MGFFLNVPLPDFDDASVKEIKKFLNGYRDASLDGPVRGGVMAQGDAAAYALVWEWGNARQTKEGPKTVKGMNPDGSSVWLSIQAPFGYIRIHEAEYVRILEQELGEVDLSQVETGKEIRKALTQVSSFAGAKIADVIRSVAPIDSGDLRESIKAASPDDPDLDVEDDSLELGKTEFTHVISKNLNKLNKAKKK
jgi:hypothetical protein